VTGGEGGSNVVGTVVNLLRRKVGQHAGMIQTVWGSANG